MISNKRACLWLCFILLEVICICHYHQYYKTETSTVNSLSSGAGSIFSSELSSISSTTSSIPITVKTNQKSKEKASIPITASISQNRFYSPEQQEDSIISLHINRKLGSSTASTTANPNDPSISTSYTKIPPKDEVDWDSIDVTEPGYPKATHLVDYDTSATEREVENHDRLLVQGMQYMKSYLNSDEMNRNTKEKENIDTNAKMSDEQNENNRDSANNITQSICLNICVCNRRIPYVNSLLLTLNSHSNEQTKKEFLDNTQVRLVNTERRPGKMNFPYLKDKLSKIPFIHDVHNISYVDEIYSDIKDRELTSRENFLSDTLATLKVCVQSGLPYCILMEEDAVVPVDFISLLLRQVIEPLEKQGVLNREDATGSVSILSLYSYYNLVFFGPHRLHYPRYTKNKYQDDRAKLNIERWGLDMLPYHPEFNIANKEYKYGTVAMFYTQESAKALVKYLTEVGVDPEHNADEFMNAEDHFPKIVGAKRKHVTPSLVNHIGFYSERMAHIRHRGMFNQLNTDSRFMFDPGHL